MDDQREEHEKRPEDPGKGRGKPPVVPPPHPEPVKPPRPSAS
jgi:hypothetical protein